ncbi:MAG: metal-dependent hydrolase [Terracidiphilus sp.]
MEPVTHFLTGACLGRAGFNRKTAYATLAAVLAAEAADLDVFWGFAGPVEELKHHRGITHTFWAVPVVAAVVVGAVWLFHRLRGARTGGTGGAPSFSRLHREKGGMAQISEFQSRTGTVPDIRPPLRQPIHWGWLYATAFVAALTHLPLDWSNNYGLRPFFPFNPRWYAGSFMFIAEPVLWALFFLAFFMPWVLGLSDREIGARRKPFRGRGWAIFALAGMFVLGCWRWAEHARALALLDNTNIASEPVLRMAAEPYPVNPFRWHAILETADFYQTAEIDTRTGSINSDPLRDVLYKPADTPAVEAAKRTLLGQVYLDWGTWAVVRDLGPEPIPGPIPGLNPPDFPPNRSWTTVEFTDLRFDYPFIGTRSATARAPLTGWVYIVDGRDEAGEAMDDREQR